ncbi:MAG: site-specific integrase [Alphaproteobacteria bacterium]|nr:site-specific integrase [Alphaproteobacteria bacterium]
MSNTIKVGPFRLRPFVRNGKQTGQWLVNVPEGFGGKRRRVLFDNRVSAEEFARKLDRAYRRGELAQQVKDERSAYSFSEIVALWLEREEARIQTRKKKQVSLETDKGRLKWLRRHFGKMEIPDISETKILSYQAMRLKAGRSPSTINSDLVTLFKILRWAKKTRLVDQIPDTVERIPDHPKEVYIPTPEEVVRIIRALPERLRSLVRFLAETGCRSGEAFNLTWSCVNEVHGYVEIKPQDGWTPKTYSSVRRVYLMPEMLEEIRQLPKLTETVFTGRLGGKITEVKKAFATAVKAAGITDRQGNPARITPHVLRKAFATWAATSRGVSQPVLQAMLGHAPGSSVTAKYYVHVNDEAKRAALVPLPMGKLG